MRSMRTIQRRLAGEAGAELAEFAAVLPIVVLLLLGIMSFARAYNVYTTITYAAQEGARAAAAAPCAMCPAAGPSDAANNAAARVTQVLQASSIDPGNIQSYSGTSTPPGCNGGAPICNSPNNITVCTNVELNSQTFRRRRGGRGTVTRVTGPASCGTTVTFEYPYQFNFPFTSISKQIVTLKADVEMPSED